eukprot:6124093-Pleurochrysis_carterae.AAC.1
MTLRVRTRAIAWHLQRVDLLVGERAFHRAVGDPVAVRRLALFRILKRIDQVDLLDQLARHRAPDLVKVVGLKPVREPKRNILVARRVLGVGLESGHLARLRSNWMGGVGRVYKERRFARHARRVKRVRAALRQACVCEIASASVRACSLVLELMCVYACLCWYGQSGSACVRRNLYIAEESRQSKTLAWRMRSRGPTRGNRVQRADFAGGCRLELLEEALVVGPEEADVRDGEENHRETLEACGVGRTLAVSLQAKRRTQAPNGATGQAARKTRKHVLADKHRADGPTDIAHARAQIHNHFLATSRQLAPPPSRLGSAPSPSPPCKAFSKPLPLAAHAMQ